MIQTPLSSPRMECVLLQTLKRNKQRGDPILSFHQFHLFLKELICDTQWITYFVQDAKNRAIMVLNPTLIVHISAAICNTILGHTLLTCRKQSLQDNERKFQVPTSIQVKLGCRLHIVKAEHKWEPKYCSNCFAFCHTQKICVVFVAGSLGANMARTKLQGKQTWLAEQKQDVVVLSTTQSLVGC